MDDSRKLHETSLLEKEDIYSCLNIADITDGDYIHEKESVKTFKFRISCYVQSDTLFVANGFEHSRNMCIKIYELGYPAKFISDPGLSWQQL